MEGEKMRGDGWDSWDEWDSWDWGGCDGGGAGGFLAERGAEGA